MDGDVAGGKSALKGRGSQNSKGHPMNFPSSPSQDGQVVPEWLGSGSGASRQELEALMTRGDKSGVGGTGNHKGSGEVESNTRGFEDAGIFTCEESCRTKFELDELGPPKYHS